MDEKLENLRLFLGGVGLSLSGGASPETKDYQKLLDRTKERPDAALIQALVLRSMPQAVYSPKNIGHFGLAHEWYAHFTSPIRRYPDLMVHRAIRHQIAGLPADEFPYGMLEMERLGDHCSMCERRADDATRDVVAWLKCEYALDRVGAYEPSLVAYDYLLQHLPEEHQHGDHRRRFEVHAHKAR